MAEKKRLAKAAPKKVPPRRTKGTVPPAKKVAPGRPAKDTAKPPPDPENVVPFRRGAGRAAGTRSTGSKTSPKAISVAERRAHAVALRRAAVSFTQIAEEIKNAKDENGKPRYDVSEGYDYRRAHEDVRAAIDRYVATAVDEYREESLARLDFALMNIVPKLASNDLAVWPKAVEALAKIERRRAALLGLDADKRFQLSGTGPDGSFVLSAMVTDPEESYEAARAALDEILGPQKQLPS